MVNWILVAALVAAAAASPQSYIVGPGHFHYEFGGQNEYKTAAPTPAAKTVQVSTPAPPVVKTVQVSTPAPVVTSAPVVKQIEYQVNQVRPVTYRVSTPRPVAQQVTVTQVPVQQYNVGQYPGQYNVNVNAQRYNTQRYNAQYDTVVSQPVVSRVTVPVTRTQTVAVQQPQDVQQAYAAQPGRNYGGYAILRYIIDIQPQGQYNYAYETENGIKAEESGDVKNVGTQDEALNAEGYYSYTGPDGVIYTVRYIADENGFRAEGDHLPKIPEAIQRALEYLRTLPPQPDEQ